MLGVMTENRRILLNVFVSYGRSLLGLALGLFTSRWVLMALGAEDLGLYGLVAGIVTFIGFFNGLLSGACERFYAYSIGMAKREGFESEGLEECRRWFSTAVFVHTVVPVAVMIVGYPIGEWAIRHWLVIPVTRIEDCVWIFRFVCFASMTGMMIAPLSAMYTAKQKIAEITAYSIFGTVCNFVFVYYMVSHPGRVWLLPYAGFTCALGLVTNLAIAMRALFSFPECRFNYKSISCISRIKQLVGFSCWTFLGAFGYMIDIQGRTFLINKGFGPVMNASGGIAGSVSGHCATLSGAVSKAFQPAIISREGAGDRRRMLSLSYRGAKISMLLCMMFVLPLMAEKRAVLELWLKAPPPLVAEACFWTLLIVLVGQMAFGLDATLAAVNKIKYVNIASFASHVLAVAVGWIGVVWFNMDFMFVFKVELARIFCYNLVACFISTHYTGYSYRRWLSDMLFKPAVVFALCIAVGLIAKSAFASLGVARLPFVFAAVETAFFSLALGFVMTREERSFICARAKRILPWYRTSRFVDPGGID